MREHEWMAKCNARFDSVEFVKAVNAHLTAIREAENKREWAREAGRFGGFLRSMRSLARVELVEALIKELAIEPTQHVAFMLMKRAFGQAAETATLDHFATPGRDASEKHMDAARAAATKRSEVVEHYGALYAWYLKRLDLVIATLKGRAHTPRPRGPGGATPPRRPPTRPTLRRVK